jgi:hypothetical protein
MRVVISIVIYTYPHSVGCMRVAAEAEGGDL